MALQGSGGGAWDWDLERGEAWWSEEMYILWGIEPGTAVQIDNSLSPVHEQDRDLLVSAVEKSIAEGGVFQCEFRIHHPERGERWIASLGRPISDESGRTLRLIGISLDITERKRAEEALRRLNEELEERVQKRTEELRLMVVQLEREVAERRMAEDQANTMGRLYRVLSKVNEAIVRAEDQETLFQQACRIAVEDGLFRMAWIGLIDPANRVLKAVVQYGFESGYLESLMIPLEDVPEGRGPTGVAAREGRIDVCNDLAQDPRMAPWREKAMARGYQSSAALPLRLGGTVVGALTLYAEQPGFFTTEEIALLESMAGDLSFAMESIEREARRRQAEEEIRGLNEELDLRVKKRTAELEFANRELESFSYSVSHDLRAPLRAIQGFSRMLMADHAAQLDAEGLRLLNVITTNTKLMTALIEDLLALSRLGRHEIRKGSFNLTDMARQVFEQLKSQEPERDLQFIMKDLPPTHGDPSLIRQVLVNLLTNAVKYTKQRKTAVIEVGGNDAANETVYYIKDNGVGFDERYADKLFGVFQRLHSGEEYEGTGVGLAIVKRITERHGGRVWAEGKVNEGATFYFALPKNRV